MGVSDMDENAGGENEEQVQVEAGSGIFVNLSMMQYNSHQLTLSLRRTVLNFRRWYPKPPYHSQRHPQLHAANTH